MKISELTNFLTTYFRLFSNLNSHYLLAYTKSGIYKHWINSNMRVSAQPNINSQQYLESPIILPPIEVQNEIATHILGLKQEIKKLRTTAESNRKAALTNFEQKIF